MTFSGRSGRPTSTSFGSSSPALRRAQGALKVSAEPRLAHLAQHAEPSAPRRPDGAGRSAPSGQRPRRTFLPAVVLAARVLPAARRGGDHRSREPALARWPRRDPRVERSRVAPARRRHLRTGSRLAVEPSPDALPAASRTGPARGERKRYTDAGSRGS